MKHSLYARLKTSAEEGRFPAAGRWIVVDVRVVRCDLPWILHSCAL